MHPRLLAAVVFAGLLLGAGCVAPSGPHVTVPDAPPDPETDVLGWEDGIWHNETLALSTENGLNETELDAVVRRAMARVEFLRRMEFEDPVPVHIESRAEFRARVKRNADGGEPSPRQVMTDIMFESLFLVGEGRSGSEAESSTTAATVIGFYSPGEDRIVLVSETDRPIFREWVLAHELVHALQFRHFEMGFNGTTREDWHARNSVVEGDARLIDHRYHRRCLGAWSCVSPDPEDGSGGGSQAHPGISLFQYFPYSDGPVFVRWVQRRGGWDAVRALYTDTPTSTARVIIPVRYGAPADQPVKIPDHSTDEWDRLDPYQSVGMPGITSMFAYTTYDAFNDSAVVSTDSFLPPGRSSLDPVRYNISYADGWRGDRLRGYSNGEARAYVWRLEWTNTSEAREFAVGYRRLLRHWGGRSVGADRWRIDDGPFEDAFRVTVSGDTVTIVNAPTVDALEAVHSD